MRHTSTTTTCPSEGEEMTRNDPLKTGLLMPTLSEMTIAAFFAMHPPDLVRNALKMTIHGWRVIVLGVSPEKRRESGA
jgi:hypothetical protein